MTISEEEIEIVVGKQRKHYEHFGYIFETYKNNRGAMVIPRNKKFKVRVEHLPEGSEQRVTKVCDTCGIKIFNQTYQSIIKGRKRNKTGLDFCRKCALRLNAINKQKNIDFHKSLAYLFPLVSNEWNFEKNNTSPSLTFAHSPNSVWWICPNCGSDYRTKVYSRTSGTGCPYCRGLKINHTNCLATTHPHLVNEWHPEKNGDLTPYNTTKGSERKVWWVCKECYKDYKSVIYSRVGDKPRSCPMCASSSGEKRVAEVLNTIQVNYVSEYKFPDCKYKRSLPFDFVLFSSQKNIVGIIEYDGGHHYKPVDYFGGKEQFRKQTRNDEIKNSYCRDKHIPLLRIPYWDYDNVEGIVIEFISSIQELSKK